MVNRQQHWAPLGQRALTCISTHEPLAVAHCQGIVILQFKWAYGIVGDQQLLVTASYGQLRLPVVVSTTTGHFTLAPVLTMNDTSTSGSLNYPNPSWRTFTSLLGLLSLVHTFYFILWSTYWPRQLFTHYTVHGCRLETTPNVTDWET